MNEIKKIGISLNWYVSNEDNKSLTLEKRIGDFLFTASFIYNFEHKLSVFYTGAGNARCRMFTNSSICKIFMRSVEYEYEIHSDQFVPFNQAITDEEKKLIDIEASHYASLIEPIKDEDFQETVIRLSKKIGKIDKKVFFTAVKKVRECYKD